MPTLGPWIDGPEYEDAWQESVDTFSDWGVSTEVRSSRASSAHHDWVVDNSYYVISGLDILEMWEDGDLAHALPDAYGWAGGFLSAGTLVQNYIQWDYTGIGSGSDAVFMSNLHGYHDYGPRSVSVASAWAGPAEWPAGAVGIEYRSPVGDASDPYNDRAKTLGVWLRPDTAFRGLVVDETEQSKTPTWATELAVGNPTGLVYNATGELAAVPPVSAMQTLALVDVSTPTSAGVVDRTLGQEVDVTAYLNNDDRLAFFTITNHAPIVTTLRTDAVMGQLSYGFGLFLRQLSIRGLFKAPDYRFIFDETPPPTYRRVFPRDDSLAGGAGRNFPPSRAIQSSNRIGGGYL